MTRLIVFDLDGTLVDSLQDLSTAANMLLAELGAATLPDPAVAGMVGEGAGVLVRRALTASGLPPDLPGALERFLECYDAHLLDSTRPYEGIRELLEELAPRGTLAVLTNKPRAATDRILTGLELAPFFSHVLGGDSAFGRKPLPEGLLHLVGCAGGTAADAILIGDSPVDLETARRAGSGVCIVSYGFGYRPVELRAGERLAASPRQVANLLSASASNAD